MRYKPIILILLFICGLNTVLINAQDTLRTHLTYDLSTEMAVGTGDYTAFQIVSNRHHVLGTRSNTANIRGAVNIEHSMGKDFTLSGTIDVIASTHADHKTYLQQCFANITYKNFYLETGAREDKQVIRNDLLSSGSFRAQMPNRFPNFELEQRTFGTSHTLRDGCKSTSMVAMEDTWIATIARRHSTKDFPATGVI